MAGLTMEELNQLVAAKLAEQQERAAAGAQVGQPGGCCKGAWGAGRAAWGAGRAAPAPWLPTELGLCIRAVPWVPCPADCSVGREQFSLG